MNKMNNPSYSKNHGVLLDTADVDEIREIAAWGILDGVTTNPSLSKRVVEISSKLLLKLLKSAMDQYLLKYRIGYRWNDIPST